MGQFVENNGLLTVSIPLRNWFRNVDSPEQQNRTRFLVALFGISEDLVVSALLAE
jgi:hypothetical protein